MKTIALVLIFTALVTILHAQQGEAHVSRAEELEQTARSAVIKDDLQLHWGSENGRLVYRINVARSEHRYFLVNMKTADKRPAFDHRQLADALALAAEVEVDPRRLPLEQIDMSLDPMGVFFRAFGRSWFYCENEGTVETVTRSPETLTLRPPSAAHHGSRSNGESTSLTFENATGGEIEIFWIDGSGGRLSYGRITDGVVRDQQTYAGHVWLVVDAGGRELATVQATEIPALARLDGPVKDSPSRNLSPDGKWTAFIRSHNLFIRSSDGGVAIQLSSDGVSADRYQGPLLWSPDSRKLVAFRTEEVEHRQVHIVDSTPSDQLQPKLISFDYRKPGDPIPQPLPRIFQIDSREETMPDHTLFANPWHLHEPAWSPDSSEFSFVYNQRGHQVMRIIGICADSGAVRTIHEHRSDTFIDYSQKFFLRRLPETRELLWASEISGYNHLYLIDEITGEIKNPVTSGEWNVREVVEVDVDNRTLLLRVVGLPGQDPYHVHYLRTRFDGGEFTRLTESDGTHRVEFSPCGGFLVATWSRVDQPPVAELRNALDGNKILELERADDTALLATGWNRPERFIAKGRDGKTDIYGIILRPSNFDPENEYPVLENIYAGPQGHFVPKAYFSWTQLHAMAELGFIVVKIDGMGTNWRNKAFHDVAWKNLSDSGFPDRIEWIKAAAETRSWMDLSRVGIYGGSAGGQSAMSALLHHGDFYHVAVSDCGCHDNRMDKIWWNEAWMGWPVDESYEENSNTTHAANLTGKLLLIVGELDTNVDPASTYQLVHALQQADKDFDFIPIIGAGHGAAETRYGQRRRADFLIRHLRGPESRGEGEKAQAL